MMKDKVQQNPWILIIGIIVIVSILFTIFSKSKQNDLDVYTESDIITSIEDTTSTEDTNIEMEIYTNEEAKFSILIPKGWEQVNMDNFPTFIHSASGSSIQIQVLDYDPNINNVNANNLSVSVIEDGMTFVNFTRTNNSQYELIYQDYQNTTYDYIEEVYWNRDKIIKLVCVFNDANYEKIKPYYTEIINSFAWKETNTIPEGYYLYYDAATMYEIAIPTSWSAGITDSTLVATDPVSGASMSVSANPNTEMLDNITATDMANIIGSGKNNFMMKSFESSAEYAYARGTYIVNGVQYISDNHIYANGTYLYFITFEYQSGMLDESIPDTCAGLFREFVPAPVEEEISTTQAKIIENSDSIQESDGNKNQDTAEIS